jgi:DNA-binding transcriptional MerR regulator
VKTSVLRFWETEFRSIRPEKTKSNQRLYGRKHVERVLQIKELLYDRGFTIAGAKKELREAVEPRAAARPEKLRDQVLKELRELLQLCDE